MPVTREIFSLRKAGNIEEAYALAVEAYAEAPADEWVIKAYGWVLYDKLKAALQNPKQEVIQQLVQEIETLNVSEADEMLSPNLKRLLDQAQPEGQQLRRAKDLDKNNQHAEARIIFRQIRKSFIGNTQFADSYGWCLFKQLKQIIAHEPVNISMCNDLFEEYLTLQVEKPSILHSNILRLAEKLVGNDSFLFMSIVKKWGYQNFLPDDWNKNLYEGKTYPGLAEKTIQLVAKSLLNQSTLQDILELMPALDVALSRIHDNIWLYYYKAKLLLKTGNYNEAEQFLKPVVKMKRTEYWAWALMGDIYKDTSLDKAISCYCKALLCPTEEKFLVNTRVSLGKLLLQNGLKSEAKREFVKSIETRKEKGYGLGSDLTQIEQEDWFTSISSQGNNTKYYSEHIHLAEEILFADLPWFDANVGEDYVLSDAPCVNRIKIYFKTLSIVNDTSVKEKQHKIYERFKRGDPVQIKAEKKEGKWQVYIIEKRDHGKKWDVFPIYIGVIDHVNSQKMIAHFIVSKEIVGIIHFDPRTEQAEAGDIVKLSIKKRKKELTTIYEAITWEKTADYPPIDICKVINGRFVIEEGKAFGFIDDYFVAPSTVEEYSLKEMNGRILSGTAVISYNKNKRTWGWKVIKFSINV